jgi:hypothetical protein
MSRLVTFATLILTLLSAASLAPALAEEEARPDSRILSDKWGFGLGGFVLDFDTTASVNTGTVIGGSIGLESDLGLESDKKTFRADGFYRFNARHSLEFAYFSISRDGASILDERIEFVDEDGETVIFDVGADVESEFLTRMFKATYRYTFVNNGRTEAGFNAGLSTYKFGLRIAGEATINDGTGQEEVVFDEAETSIIAPVPTFGMFVTHAFKPRLILRMRAEFFDISVGDYTGRVVDTQVLLDYFVSRRVGLGVGFNTIDINVQRKGDQPFRVGYKQTGLLGYVSFVF